MHSQCHHHAVLHHSGAPTARTFECKVTGMQVREMVKLRLLCAAARHQAHTYACAACAEHWLGCRRWLRQCCFGHSCCSASWPATRTDLELQVSEVACEGTFVKLPPLCRHCVLLTALPSSIKGSISYRSPAHVNTCKPIGLTWRPFRGIL